MTLDERIHLALKDQAEMDALIQDYLPFIKAAISKALKRYVDQNDPLVTVGMMGFHEAAQKYKPEKGGFLSYAQMIIRNRLIDELRREGRQTRLMVLEKEGDDETENYNNLYDKLSVDWNENRRLEDQRKDDLLLYMQVLKSWDLTMPELVQISPKKKSLLELYQKVGRYIGEDVNLLAHMRETKRLPAKEILSAFKIDRKRLDRGRKSILAVAELWAGDFETLHDFIKGR